MRTLIDGSLENRIDPSEIRAANPEASGVNRPTAIKNAATAESAISTVAPRAGQSQTRVTSTMAIARRNRTSANPAPRLGNVPKSLCIFHIQMKCYRICQRNIEPLSDLPTVVISCSVAECREPYTGADLNWSWIWTGWLLHEQTHAHWNDSSAKSNLDRIYHFGHMPPMG
jgi:hypothetical protein